MNIIDSSVLVSYFWSEEKNHLKATNIIEKLETLTITDYILLEVTTVLQIRESSQVAKKVMDYLVNNSSINIIRLTNEELLDTIKCFQKQKSNLSFVDISLMILATNRNGRVFTFDKKLNNRLKKEHL